MRSNATKLQALLNIFKSNEFRNDLWIGLSFIILLLVCYSNSFRASWHYDDFTNIVSNAKVHMTELSSNQIKGALSGGWDYQIISRPLAYLSFALNHRIDGLNVLGYHVFNWVVHLLTTLFLFLFIRDTLKLPILEHRYAHRAAAIAWLATALWACHPIQVTAVTYIVQRMTSMAGLFYVLAMFCYLHGRCADRPWPRTRAFMLCAFFAACALLTKENAVMIPYSLLLYEFLFFQKIDRYSIRKHVMIALILSAGIFFLSMLYTNPFRLLAPFENRPFTIVERLLTQPRVLFIYLSIIAVPMTARLSLFHDLDISHSLIEPWTTLSAVSGVVGVIALLLLIARRNRLIAFCGLFFFLNHAVESSVLNLELIYEHRNYIPSMLLFVPVAIAADASVQFFYYRPIFQYLLRAVTALVVVTLCFLTFEYNKSFQTEYALWAHAVVRYPKASLAHNNLGKVYWSLGLFDKSYEEIKTAVQLDRFSNRQQKGTAYYNLGIYEAYKERNFAKALDSFMKAKSIDSDDPKIWHEIARGCMQTGNYPAAQTLLNAALARWPDNAETMTLLGIGFIKQDQYAKAKEIALEVLKKDEKNDMALIIRAQCDRYAGDTIDALKDWLQVPPISPFSIIACLSLTDIYYELDMVEISQLFENEFKKRLEKSQERAILDFSVVNHAILPFRLEKEGSDSVIYLFE